MNNLINTRPGIAVPERVRESKTTGRAVKASACNDITTNAERQQMFVSSLLSHGAEMAISTCELLRMTGIKSTRLLQVQIAHERGHGALILSNSKGGYFLPDSGAKGEQELRVFIRTLNSRALSTLRTLRTAKRALRYSQMAQIQIGGGADAKESRFEKQINGESVQAL